MNIKCQKEKTHNIDKNPLKNHNSICGKQNLLFVRTQQKSNVRNITENLISTAKGEEKEAVEMAKEYK